MQAFARLSVIGAAVTALGLAAQTYAAEVFVQCPPALQTALDNLPGGPKIAIIVPANNTQLSPIRCVSGLGNTQECNNSTVGQGNSCGPQKFESIAIFSVGNSNRLCWYPVGGTGGCSKAP
jgi:hypothetical protein